LGDNPRLYLALGPFPTIGTLIAPRGERYVTRIAVDEVWIRKDNSESDGKEERAREESQAAQRSTRRNGRTTTMSARNPRHPNPLAIYVSLVVLTGVVLILASWLRADSVVAVSTSYRGFVFWLFFAIAAECFWISLPGDRGMISMGLAADLAVLFVLPMPQALFVGAVSVALTDLLVHRRRAIRALFNSAQTIVSITVAAAVMHMVERGIAPTGSSAFLHHPVAALLTLPAFCAVNTGLVSVAIALESERSLWRSWRESFGFLYHYQNCAILFALGLQLVVAVEIVGYVCGVVALFLLFTLRDAYKYRMRRRPERSAEQETKAAA
jgi:hypothetical protein